MVHQSTFEKRVHEYQATGHGNGPPTAVEFGLGRAVDYARRFWQDRIARQDHTPTSCSHFRQPFSYRVTDRKTITVFLSAWRDRSPMKQKPGASAAVYLADTWLDRNLWANQGLWPPYFLYVPWPDFGVTEDNSLQSALRWATDILDSGYRLDIGCEGGHGRTGTFVSSLMVWQGWAPAEAIKTLRDGYCDRAVENKKQENLVRKVERWRRMTC